MKIIELTHKINENMPVYPGTQPPILKQANTYEKDGFKETKISMFSHTGTHMDPPAHIFKEGKTLDQFPTEQFYGPALVIDCKELNEGDFITMNHLNKYKEKINQVDFLLFHTGWDQYWGSDAYFGNYPCIDEEVLDFILQSNYKGIGFDVIGLDPIDDVNLTRHKKLFKNKDIVNIENLKNLHLCGNEIFTLSCSPLFIENSDGAPIRAFAILNQKD